MSGVDGELTARLALVEQRVRAVVAARQAVDPKPDDAFRGLYLSPEEADRLLAGAPPEPPPAAEPADPEPGGALDRLAREFELAPVDLDLLLIALLPDLEPRYEQLYGYLNDDVSRRRACAALALELLGAPARVGAPQAALRARLAPGGPLVAGGLLLVEEPERPFLTRPLRVPDEVAAHLLGTGAPDPALAALTVRPARLPGPAAEALTAALRQGVRLVHLREPVGGSALALAATALAAADRPALCLDLAALAAEPHPELLLPRLARAARLTGGALVIGPLEALDAAGQGERSRLLRRLAALPVPVLFTGTGTWDPLWAEESPLLVTAPPLAVADRVGLFREALGPAEPVAELAELLSPYQLTPDQLRRAARAAARQAQLAGGPVGPAEVRTGVRAQNAAGLERLARRVEPAVGWADLVLPPGTARQLGELALRARHRDRVLGEWRMRPGGGRGRGVMALFAGDSGTGKTMSAEVVAADLGVDLYVVDLSTVVDKYVGETEKNLERIFTEAAGINGILLFDEADAVFGKRSEVKDAHDRYANMESAYLLQRMESFDGIAILTTNLRANLDEAFTRRLDIIVDFPVPDLAGRRALWDRCLGAAVPRADGLDLDLAARFDLAGGSIRACTVTAGYRAAAAGRPVDTGDLMTAVRGEYRKLGRLVLASEFGEWAAERAD
ncbi:ATP-binding protein [Kitasatospora sp. NPDC058965]|uniref:ATP-binding protein n=1 Tax=Kitasatospora sp. NPDC058965 TaxID=3346682 RepID=UPI0036BD52F6